MPSAMTIFTAAICFTMISVACGSRSEVEEDVDALFILEAVKTKSMVMLPGLDTTISLAGVSSARQASRPLNPATARKILFEHFKKQGYLIPGDEYAVPEDTGAGTMEVTYDTLFLAKLNNDKYQDAFISYWLAPHGASGQCWQPHKAVIMSTGKGYQLMNEDIIPTNFSVDSVLTRAGQVVILANDYDCSNHVIIRNIKILIQ